MFYDKDYALTKPDRKRIALSNFKGYDETKVSRNLPCDYVDCVYNYKFKYGRLVNPYGISALEFEGEVIPPTPDGLGKSKLFITRAQKDGKLKSRLVLSHEGGLECFTAGDSQWTHIDGQGVFDVGVNYLFDGEDLLLLSGKSGLKALSGNQLVDVKDGVKILDMCVHYERIYAVVEGIRNSLWFSDDFNPYNWNVSLDEGGYIDFDGSLGGVNAVKSFDNYLYVFCDFGIYRLTAYADQTQFAMKKVYASSERIFAKSITNCGAYIAFASQDGIYLFDGYDVSRYSVKTNDLLRGGFKDVSACYAHHKYILSFTNDIDSDYEVISRQRSNNVVMLFDLTDKSVDFMRGISFFDVKTVGAYGEGKIIGLSEDSLSPVQLDDSGLYLGMPYQKYWQSGEIDFDRPAALKVVRGVEYSADSQYTLGIIANGERREFILSPQENRQSVYVKSDKFIFYIRSDNVDENIRPPILEVDFLK
ncbi:MAG: hypothetical protein K2M75_01945 [Clostridia bacterium]|nr:hypothetical protein [Clostridia bacterium]